jgi:hypothetical protein
VENVLDVQVKYVIFSFYILMENGALLRFFVWNLNCPFLAVVCRFTFFL